MILTQESVDPKQVINGKLYKIFNSNNSDIENIDISILAVDPGKSGRLHHHKHTQEVFYVIEGDGMVAIDKTENIVGSGDCIYIPRGCSHRLINPSKKTFKVLIMTSPPLTSNDTMYDDSMI